MLIRVNIGCGKSPTEGWHNYDNSWSIRLAKAPFLCMLLNKAGVLSKPQYEFITFAQNANILWADATKRIPEQNGSVDVVYSSHMLEHLDQEEVTQFLAEVRRVLKSGGIIRIAVPNIRYHIETYLKTGDADSFVKNTSLSRYRFQSPRDPKGLKTGLFGEFTPVMGNLSRVTCRRETLRV